MRYYRIKEGQTPPYPDDEEAKFLAEKYRVEILNNTLIETKVLKHPLNHYIEVTVTGGKDNLFLVIAKPPAGFWTKDLDEIKSLRYLEGWLLRYIRPQHRYEIVSSTIAFGYATFQTDCRYFGL